MGGSAFRQAGQGSLRQLSPPSPAHPRAPGASWDGRGLRSPLTAPLSVLAGCLRIAFSWGCTPHRVLLVLLGNIFGSSFPKRNSVSGWMSLGSFQHQPHVGPNPALNPKPNTYFLLLGLPSNISYCELLTAHPRERIGQGHASSRRSSGSYLRSIFFLFPENLWAP